MNAKFQCKMRKVCRFQINGIGNDYGTYCDVSECNCESQNKKKVM